MYNLGTNSVYLLCGDVPLLSINLEQRLVCRMSESLLESGSRYAAATVPSSPPPASYPPLLLGLAKMNTSTVSLNNVGWFHAKFGRSLFEAW